MLQSSQKKSAKPASIKLASMITPTISQEITHIFVGSANPVKINAVVSAASETWPSVQVIGHDVASGVSSQPVGDNETRDGARNRAKEALEVGLKQLNKQLNQSKNKVFSESALGVGLEGGVVELEDGLYSTVWVCVVDAQGNLTEANGARFKVPEPIATLILKGGDMGPVVEKLVGVSDVRQKQGMIGIITNGFVDRTEEYSGIAKMALGLWYGRKWYRVCDLHP